MSCQKFGHCKGQIKSIASYLRDTNNSEAEAPLQKRLLRARAVRPASPPPGHPGSPRLAPACPGSTWHRHEHR
eukprot:6141264-Prymnesium_polylepis.1